MNRQAWILYFYRGNAETNMQMSGHAQPKPHPPVDS